MNLIQKIKDIRERKGLSQAELASKAGLSTTYISLLEGGKKSPTLNSLEKISKALEIPFPILSFMALDENDIAPSKRDAFAFIQPSINAMLKEFFAGVNL